MKGWKGFFPLKNQKKGRQSVSDKNRFNNFPQRDNQELIRQLEAMEGKTYEQNA